MSLIIEDVQIMTMSASPAGSEGTACVARDVMNVFESHASFLNLLPLHLSSCIPG